MFFIILINRKRFWTTKLSSDNQWTLGRPTHIRTHRLRTTTFLGRSQKQLRPTDLVLAAQDVSKIHCSITAIGNAIAGYRLSVVVTADAKAPVSVNGAKLKEKGKPYPLKVLTLRSRKPTSTATFTLAEIVSGGVKVNESRTVLV